MVALFLTFVSLFALRIAWGTWKATLRDVTRDKLFNLRDEWRSFFIEHGFSLETPEYKKVREMINDYLRYTARFRLVGLFYTAFFVPKELYFETIERMDEEFRSSNATIAKEIDRIRKKTVSAIQGYMLGTSILLFPLLAGTIAICMFVGTGELIERAKMFLKQRADNTRCLSPNMIEMAVAA